MTAAFVDTSMWLAFVDARDARHEAALRWMEGFTGRMVTSTDVLDETVTVVAARCGFDVAARLGDLLQRPDEVDLIEVDRATQEAGWALFLQRADKRYSLTDCTSFVVMRRLRMRDAATFDSDFSQEGFRIVP